MPDHTEETQTDKGENKSQISLSSTSFDSLTLSHARAPGKLCISIDTGSLPDLTPVTPYVTNPIFAGVLQSSCNEAGNSLEMVTTFILPTEDHVDSGINTDCKVNVNSGLNTDSTEALPISSSTSKLSLVSDQADTSVNASSSGIQSFSSSYFELYTN